MGPAYEIGARLPTHADGAIEVGIGRSDRAAVRLVAEEAGGRRVELHEGRAVYRDAFPSTDVVFVASATRVEWLYLLRDASAPAAFAFRVELPLALPTVRAEPSGGLAFFDARGRPRLRMPRPYALDARGARREADVTWSQGRLFVRLDPQGLSFPVLLDPAMEVVVWESKGLPKARATAMAFDSKRSRTVLFGGTSGTLLGDTWEWDGAAWLLLSTIGPSARAGHAMVYDAKRAKTILHGGRAGATNLGDTWEWDGSAWSMRATSGPSPGQGHAMAYDSARERVVHFGSLQTWEWDGATWTQRATGGPSGRTYAAMAYDPGRSRTVLFGGDSGGVRLGDTWEWDGAAWTQRVVPGPAARSQHAMVHDSTRGKIVLFGGASAASDLEDTWEWDGAAWSQKIASGPSRRVGHGMAFDSGRGKVVLFGGQVTLRPTADTWEWDGTSWSQRNAAPAASTGVALAYDSARGKTVLFGGGDGWDETRDTWEWDGATWSLRSSTGPGPRRNHGMAYDVARARTLLFGGYNSTYFSDTWEWDGATWNQRMVPGPSGRLRHGMAYDAGRSRVVLYGGQSLMGYQGDTWEWDGTAWSQRAMTGPSSRQGPAMAYDGKRGKTMLFGGLSGLDLKQDTWEWDGTMWSQNAAAGPPGRRYSAMAYDGFAAKIVLMGGLGAGNTEYLQDTWEWDGAAWSQRAATGPSGRWDHALAYDSMRKRTVMHGGPVGDSTWEYHRRGGPCTMGSQCETGNCVDGVCCDQTACGPCQACDLAASPGACAAVISAPDPDSCTGEFTCGSQGQCGRANGRPCSDASGCLSGFCSDGVCCNVACADPCDVCTAALGAPADGMCVPAAQGFSPPGNVCGVYACPGSTSGCATSCVSDSYCAPGHYCAPGGSCQARKAPGSGCNTTAGADCLAAGCRVCAGAGSCSDGVCCETPCGGPCDRCSATGVCMNVTGMGSPSCGGYLCNGTSGACPAACSGDGQCAAGFYCATGGACLPQKRQAQACSPTADCAQEGCRQCATGFCADGYCCDRACAGACDDCSTTPGTCAFAAVGHTGAPTCAPFRCSGATSDCPTTCMTDDACAAGAFCTAGACVGKKGIGQMCSAAAECSSGSCANGICCQSICNLPCQACNVVPGVCTAAPGGSPGSPACEPYACNGTATTCPTTCTSDGECVKGSTCAFGACTGRLPQGRPCTGSGQCQSNSCVDGVCCSSGCPGACVACNLPGSVGECVAVPKGQDPRNQCPGQGPCKAVCGEAGLCVYPDDKVPCGGTSCATNLTLVRAPACDGKGTCVERGRVECTPYTCAGATCASECLDDSICVKPNLCQNRRCGLHSPAGALCRVPSDCESGFCVDGVCCQSTCAEKCQRCDLVGADNKVDGVCRVPADADPDGDCKGEGLCGGTCAKDGACTHPGPERWCDICKACDGKGLCSALPPGRDDDKCGAGKQGIACQALSTECRTYTDLTSMRCVRPGICARPNDPTSCTQFTDAPAGTSCPLGPNRAGVCQAGQCTAAASDAAAGPDTAAAPPKGSDGCSCSLGDTRSPSALALFLFVALLPAGLRRIGRR